MYNFLQPGRHLSQVIQSHTEKQDLMSLEYSDVEEATSSCPVFAKSDREACKRAADIIMVRSDSDDDAPYVPLAQRLKKRQQNLISASSSVTNGKHDEQYSPSDLALSELSCQIGFTESEPIFSSNQTRTENHRALDGLEGAPLPQWWLPPECSSWAGSTNTSPAKKKAAKRTAEEIQASRQEALKRKQARERQQRDKEALNQQQQSEKAGKKALTEAAKALRPEECMKHMVVVVDPGEQQRENMNHMK